MANDAVRSSNSPRVAARTTDASSDAQKVCEGMRNGDSGPTVNALQSFLNERTGAGLKVDGKFGPKTEAAVKSFQAQCGLPQTGRIDAATVARIQGKEAAPTKQAETSEPAVERQAASTQDVDSSRTKMKTREELMRARVDGADKATKAGQTYDVVTDEQVAQANQSLDEMRGALDEQKAAVADARKGVQAEVQALEAKKNRHGAEEALLLGKKSQDQILGELEKHIDLKKEGLEAARTAVGDGILTEGEAQGLERFSTIVGQKEEALAKLANNADRMVGLAEQAGARVPQVAAKPDAKKIAADAKADAIAKTEVAAPKADDVKNELKDVRAKITERRADLDIAKSVPPKTPQAKAELGIKEQELKLLQKRAADLGKAEELLQKGPLSAEDAKALATSKEQLELQTKTLEASKKAFDDVGKLRDSMVKDAGSVEQFVAKKQKAFDEANGALERAKGRGNEDAIRAAFAKAEKAKAELGTATRAAHLVDKTLEALTDGDINASEQKLLGGVQQAIDEAKARAAAMEAKLPELEKKKHFGSDLADRVFSWFTSSADTDKAATKYGRDTLLV